MLKDVDGAALLTGQEELVVLPVSEKFNQIAHTTIISDICDH